MGCCDENGKKGSNKYAPLSLEKAAKVRVSKRVECVSRVSLAIVTIIMVITYIGAFMVSVYYPRAMGDAGTLMGFIAGPTLFIFVLRRWTKIGWEPSAITGCVILLIVMALLGLLYLANRSLVLVDCNDAAKKAADPCLAIDCTNNEGAIIGIIVFVSVVVVAMIGLSIANCACTCHPARIYRDLRDIKEAQKNKDGKKGR